MALQINITEEDVERIMNDVIDPRSEKYTIPSRFLETSFRRMYRDRDAPLTKEEEIEWTLIRNFFQCCFKIDGPLESHFSPSILLWEVGRNMNLIQHFYHESNVIVVMLSHKLGEAVLYFLLEIDIFDSKTQKLAIERKLEENKEKLGELYPPLVFLQKMGINIHDISGQYFNKKCVQLVYQLTKMLLKGSNSKIPQLNALRNIYTSNFSVIHQTLVGQSENVNGNSKMESLLHNNKANNTMSSARVFPFLATHTSGNTSGNSSNTSHHNSSSTLLNINAIHNNKDTSVKPNSPRNKDAQIYQHNSETAQHHQKEDIKNNNCNKQDTANKNGESKPKLPPSAYILFCNDNRTKLKQENPSISFSDLAKKLADLWNSISEEEKDKYRDDADEKRRIYKQELEEYKNRKHAIAMQELCDKEEEIAKGFDEKIEMKKDVGENSKEKPTRPRTAYILFAHEMRTKIKQEMPNARIVEICKITCDRWEKLSEEERDIYENKAKVDRQRYMDEIAEFRSKGKSCVGSPLTSPQISEEDSLI